MTPYSQDLRDRIIEALEADLETRQEIAETYGVSRWYVQKVWRRWRETGNRAVLPRGRRPCAHLGDARRADSCGS